jgi:hypothetical protein
MLRRRIALGWLAVFALLAWKAGAEEAARPKRLLLTFLGDVMAHDVNYHAPDYGAIYRAVRPLLERDSLTFANLETPVDPSRECSNFPLFNVGPAYLQAAVEAGIEVFSLANNHAFDQGPEGLAATLASLEGAGRGSFRRIWYAGTREDLARDFAPVRITRDGLRIGFLAATQDLNLPLPEPYVLRVDYGRPAEAEAFLSLVREAAAGCDLLVVSYHGGREYARQPEPGRVRFFRRLLGAGADIVWGHHPHVLQDFELAHRSARAAGRARLDRRLGVVERVGAVRWRQVRGHGGAAHPGDQRARPAGDHGSQHLPRPVRAGAQRALDGVLPGARAAARGEPAGVGRG